ncbi:class I SAM-dependent methyltransferase [Candidatus Woesearchaeota archaeon]|nr:class I SAM-dependent methyltransferase [Candidatus Woesearchaeota archaeon]
MTIKQKQIYDQLELDIKLLKDRTVSFESVKDAGQKYDISSPTYINLHKDEQINKIRLIANEIRPKPNEKLLNIGCGPFFSDKFFDCQKYGIDPSKELLNLAKRNHVNAELTLGRAEELPYEDNFFDYIVSVSALHHVEDIELAMDEIKRVLSEKKHKKNFCIALSILTESSRFKIIEKSISYHFTVQKIILEGRDTIFFI